MERLSLHILILLINSFVLATDACLLLVPFARSNIGNPIHQHWSEDNIMVNLSDLSYNYALKPFITKGVIIITCKPGYLWNWEC